MRTWVKHSSLELALMLCADEATREAVAQRKAKRPDLAARYKHLAAVCAAIWNGNELPTPRGEANRADA